MIAARPRRVLAAILVLTLMAAYFAPQPEAETLQLSERARTATERASESGARGGVQRRVEVLAIRPRGQGDEASAQGWFNARQWTAPEKSRPVKVKFEEPSPPPQAPPLPFKALGRYEDEGVEFVFLQYSNQNLAVRVGDTIGADYKVESLSGNTLTLLYIPLNQAQTMSVGGAN